MSKTLKLMFDKYGPTLSLTELGECLKVTEKTLQNQISAGRCPIKTWKEGKFRLCATEDVAAYIESMRAS